MATVSVFRELKAFAKNALKYHSHCIMKQCDAMVEAASSYCSLEAKIMKKRGRNLNLGQITYVILIFTIDCRKPYTNDFIFP